MAAHARTALGAISIECLSAVHPLRASQASFLFEDIPVLHDNLARVELPFLGMASFAGALLLSHGLTCVTPAEVVKVPEGIGGKDQVPNWERQQVDSHPEDVGDSVSCDDDEDTRKTKDEREEDQRDDWRLGSSDGSFDSKSN